MSFSGNKVRAYREQRGMTQAELAEKAGVTQSFISDLEGNKKFPLLSTMDKIAHALGIDVTDLFDS